MRKGQISQNTCKNQGGLLPQGPNKPLGTLGQNEQSGAQIPQRR